MSDVHEKDLVARMASSLRSGKYSDLTITCKGRTFKVHRHVLCMASKFFAAACDGEFQEAEQRKINLSDDDPDAVVRMLAYLYTSTYDDEDGSDFALHTDFAINDTPSSTSIALGEAAAASIPIKSSALMTNVLVHALADKYDIQLLKQLSKTKFEVRAAGDWAIEEIVTVLAKVYETTPTKDSSLREPIMRVCAKYIDRLILHEGFKNLLQDDAAISFDMMCEVRNKYSEADADLADIGKMKEWTKKQERLLKAAMSQHVVCTDCLSPMDLSSSNGAAGRWSGSIAIECRKCNFRYVEP
ncbi:MAG: hypothetical protein Q9171_001526 [Xanthocarpia ochracea]